MAKSRLKGPFERIREVAPTTETATAPIERGENKAGFILRTKIYAVYADHFAHVGCVFSATNADLRRSDRADGKYKHSYNTPTFTMNCAPLLKLCWPGNVDAGLSLARYLCVYASYKINPSPWNGTQTAFAYVCVDTRDDLRRSINPHYARICVNAYTQKGIRTTAYEV